LGIVQYAIVGSDFGGMSGVVYALVGYVWMRGKYDRGSGLFIDRTNLMISLIWLVLCFTGAMGAVANFAHLAGLIAGTAWGRISAYFASRRPE
jgi:GlpG protein